MTIPLHSFSQFENLELTLEVLHPVKYDYFKFDMKYYPRTDHYAIAVKNKSGSGDNKYIRDTTYIIGKNKFNEIAKAAASISSVNILQNVDFANLYVRTDPVEYILTVKYVFGDGVTYRIFAPFSETKKRNLTTFLHVCKELVLTTGLSVRKVL